MAYPLNFIHRNFKHCLPCADISKSNLKSKWPSFMEKKFQQRHLLGGDILYTISNTVTGTDTDIRILILSLHSKDKKRLKTVILWANVFIQLAELSDNGMKSF
jgi:hypothetical protein